MKLSTKILIGMAAGIAVGAVLNGLAGMENAFFANLSAWLVNSLFDVIGSIFIASLKLLVVPLVFVSLVCGSSAMGVNARMGHMAAKTLGLYLLTTAIAIIVILVSCLHFAGLAQLQLSCTMSAHCQLATPAFLLLCQ